MPFVYEYPRPAVTVDTVIFTVDQMTLKVLLIQRGVEPYRGGWAFPGGFVHVGDLDQGEDLEEAAFRELQEETHLARGDVFLEQLYTFGRPGRDPRGRVISVAYYALMSAHLLPKVQAGDDAADAAWVDVDEAVRAKLAFDHDHMLEVALQRLRGKIDYDPRLAMGLVPQKFTQAELRRVYEVVKGRHYDRGNFSKRFRRMLTDRRIMEVRGQRMPKSAGRPAKLYSLAKL